MIKEKLWYEKRHFIKPLRYEGEPDVFPESLLEDVPGSEAVPLRYSA